MPDQHNISSQKALQNLIAAFSESISSDKNNLKAELSEEKIDPDALVFDGLLFVKMLQGRARLQLGKQNTLARVESIKKKIRSAAPELKSNHKETLARMLFGGSASLGVNFNKLNELGDSDILDMLDEIKLLELLDVIEKENNTLP